MTVKSTKANRRCRDASEIREDGQMLGEDVGSSSIRLALATLTAHSLFLEWSKLNQKDHRVDEDDETVA